MAIQIGSHLTDERFLKIYGITRHQMSREKCWTCDRNPAEQSATILNLEPTCEVCADQAEIRYMDRWGYEK
mgnify:CR=1 FL=1